MAEQFGVLEEINTYYLAGTRATSHESAVLGPGGLANDHACVLYAAAGDGHKRLSQKQIPSLAQLIAVPDCGTLRVIRDPRLVEEGLSAWGVVIPALSEVALHNVVEVDEFGDLTLCYDMGDRVASAFSAEFGRELRVGRKATEWLRGGGILPARRANATLHIAQVETADALAGAVEGGVAGRPIDRLRANLVIKGFPPFADAGWVGGTLLIGQAERPIPIDRHTKRCSVPGNDQVTGENMKDLQRAYPETFKAPDDGKPTVGVYGHFAGQGFVEIRRGDSVRFVPGD